MATILDCITNVKNIGASACKKFPQGLAGFIKTPLDFTISASNAAVTSNWQDAIVAAAGVRIFLFPEAFDYSNESEEAQRQTSGLGKQRQVRVGEYRFRFLFDINLEQHKSIYSHLGTAGRIFLIDTEKKLIGTSTDGGTTLKGFLLGQFSPEKAQLGDGSNISTSPVYIALSDNTELDVNGVQIDFSTQFAALNALTDVNLLEVGSSSATTVVVSVKSALDNVGVVGLVIGDFNLTGLGGSPSGVVDNADGTYTISGTGFTSGNVDLVSSDNLTITAYESTGAVAITI